MKNYKNSKIGRETAQKYGDIIEMERPRTEESLRKHHCGAMTNSLPQKSSAPSGYPSAF